MANITRRAFVAVTACLLPEAGSTQESTRVRETDPVAVEFGYRHDTTQVDESKFTSHSADQKCSGCQLYLSRTGDAWAGCPLFAPNQVAANGWCSQWFKRMA